MNEQKSGIGFLGLLQLLFIGLKLTGFIYWGWLWVLSPVWIPIAMFVIFIMIYNTIYLTKIDK